MATHRLSYAPEYRIWAAMRHRCNNPNDRAFHNYGGRDIRVCERWSAFEAFIADIGRRPQSDLTIERINNDGDYCPENVRWATRRENNLNRRVYRIRPDNTSGHPGIYRNGAGWIVRVGYNPRRSLGTYSTIEQAVEAKKRGINV